MNPKSILQEYFTLSTDKNGIMPPMHKSESNAGMVAAGIMDLLLNNIITMEKKKITVIKGLPSELRHITSLYEYLQEKSHLTDKLMRDYYTGSKINKLFNDVGESLLADGFATKGTGGLFGPKVTYIPEQSYKEKLTDTLKSVVLRDEEITSHNVALLVILKESKSLNQYFSKQESKELSVKLKGTAMCAFVLFK